MESKELGPMILMGRDFTSRELEFIKEIVELYPKLSRAELSKTICENISWQAPNGKNKHNSCLRALEKLEDEGYLKLPPLHITKPYRKRKIDITERTDPDEYIKGRVDQYGKIKISKGKAETTGLWNEYVQRYHYLGYKAPFGLHQKYFITGHRDQILGCILYSSSSWALECRDQWIGWGARQRVRNLYRVINNSRFLILPWVHLKNLASHALSLAQKQVVCDWEVRFGYKPVLIETFVDPDFFRGTCYRAGNWKFIGKTKGRGRDDRYHQWLSSTKEVYVYILGANFRQELFR